MQSLNYCEVNKIFSSPAPLMQPRIVDVSLQSPLLLDIYHTALKYILIYLYFMTMWKGHLGGA